MRTIKPETFTSETLSGLSVHARWTFAGLWTYVDDEGRGRSVIGLIKAAIWPLDDDVTAQDVSAYLDELEAEWLICRYSVQGKSYLHVVNFGEHQHPNRPLPSKLPPCSRRTHGGLSESSVHPHPQGPATPGGTRQPSSEAVGTETASSEHETAGQGGLTDDSLNPHGALKRTSFTNTPTTSPTARAKGDGDGEVDGEVEPAEAEPREDVERLCAHLADCVAGNGNKRPSITQKWRDSARLMLDRDGRTEQQVRAAIDWCQDNEFWRKNVMSMPKLREQYDRLRMDAEDERRKHGGLNGSQRAPGPDRARGWVAAGAAFQAQMDESRRELPS